MNNTFNYSIVHTYPTDGMGCNLQKNPDKYWDFLCGEYQKHNTRKNNYNTAKQLWKYTDGIITQETIEQWKIHLNKYKPNTINTRRNETNRFLEWYGRSDLKLKTPGAKDTDQITLTENEIDTLIYEAKKHPETNLIINLLWNGIRPQTAIETKISNIDQDKLYLKDTKTGDNHVILSPQTQKAIKAYLQVRPIPLSKEYKDYLLLCNTSNWKHKPYKTTLPLNKQIKRLAKECSITKNVTSYTIRRTSATLRLDKYSKYYAGDIKIVQRLFRHKRPETTLKYDQKNDEDLRKYLSEIGKDLKPTGKDLTPSENTEPLNNLGLHDSPQHYKIFENEDNNSFTFSISIFYDCLDQASFVVTNGMYRECSEVISLGVGHCFSYTHTITLPFFDMRSNPISSLSISYITHGHALNYHDTRQGTNFEKIHPIFSFSPHHPQPSPASELPICCLSKGLLQICNSNTKMGCMNLLQLFPISYLNFTIL